MKILLLKTSEHLKKSIFYARKIVLSSNQGRISEISILNISSSNYKNSAKKDQIFKQT